METTTFRTDDAVVMHLDGRLTADGDGAHLMATVGLMADQQVPKLVLDLRDVSYVDSTCLGEIIAAYRTLERFGRRLRLVNVPPRVQHLLDLSGLTSVLCDPAAPAAFDRAALSH